MNNRVVFSKSAKNFVLDCFDKQVDGEGYIVEKDDPAQRVLTKDGQYVLYEQFGGIRRGSEIFIKSDLPSLIQLLDDLKD